MCGVERSVFCVYIKLKKSGTTVMGGVLKLLDCQFIENNLFSKINFLEKL